MKTPPLPPLLSVAPLNPLPNLPPHPAPLLPKPREAAAVPAGLEPRAPSAPSPLSLKWLQERSASPSETRMEVQGQLRSNRPGAEDVYTHTHESGQSSCSHGVEGVLFRRTAWDLVQSSMALLCSVLGHLFRTQVWNPDCGSPDVQIKFINMS